MTVKLSGARRSYGVEKHFREKYSISVNFSSEHCGYAVAYRYACKDKAHHQILHSPGHANLMPIGPSPKTKNAMKTYSANSKKGKYTVVVSSSSTATALSTLLRAPKSKRTLKLLSF